MAYKTLLVDRNDQVTTITLNRPEAKNAMNPQMHFDMCAALDQVEHDEECRVLVLTGAGDAFCAGMDLKEYFNKLVGTLLAPRDARYLVMTGRPIDGVQAAQMRLVNSAVAPDKLREATLELAEDLKKKNPAVLACAKEVLRIDPGLSLEDALAWETAKWTELDAVEKKTWHKGVKQFKEQKSFRPGLETYQWKEE